MAKKTVLLKKVKKINRRKHKKKMTSFQIFLNGSISFPFIYILSLVSNMLNLSSLS